MKTKRVNEKRLAGLVGGGDLAGVVEGLLPLKK